MNSPRVTTVRGSTQQIYVSTSTDTSANSAVALVENTVGITYVEKYCSCFAIRYNKTEDESF